MPISGGGEGRAAILVHMHLGMTAQDGCPQASSRGDRAWEAVVRTERRVVGLFMPWWRRGLMGPKTPLGLGRTPGETHRLGREPWQGRRSSVDPRGAGVMKDGRPVRLCPAGVVVSPVNRRAASGMPLQSPTHGCPPRTAGPTATAAHVVPCRRSAGPYRGVVAG